MASELPERLTLVREFYVDAFRTIVSGVDESEFAMEPVLRNAEGEAIGEGPLNLPCRVDMYELASGDSRMVDSPGVPKLPELSTSVDGVEDCLRPFIWDYARMKVIHTGLPFPTDELKDWFDDWFDVDELEPLIDEVFTGCIHFMSDPVTVENETSFTVDFGTAPEKAFLTLIDCFRPMGTCRVEVTSLD